MKCPTLLNAKTVKERDMVKLFEQIHFHIDHPENHNLRIRNIHKKMLEYYEDGRWITDSRDQILEDAIHNCGYKLSEIYNENKKEIHEEINSEQDGYGSLYVRQQLLFWLEKIDNQNVALYKDIKEKLLICIIHNKVMIYERKS